MDYVKAFLIGGLICALVQILMEKTKMMPGRIMVLLVCTGAVLGAVGVYEPFRRFAGAGASVPLLGFGNVLWKGVKEAVDADRLLRYLQRRLPGQRRGHQRGPGVRLPGQSDFPAEDEEMKVKGK